MITLCWAAKGGSGTTVVAATRALATAGPTLVVDLAGDLPAAIGLPEPDGPGVHDWMGSEASADRLSNLEVSIDGDRALLPAGAPEPSARSRWTDLAMHLAHEPREVIIDVGTKPPPDELARIADRSWLVTRACYLSLRAAVRYACRPTGVVVVAEPGRALSTDDIEAAIGAPVVATVLVDPSVARAVDAGLLVSHLPAAFRRRLREAA